LLSVDLNALRGNTLSKANANRYSSEIDRVHVEASQGTSFFRRKIVTTSLLFNSGDSPPFRILKITLKMTSVVRNVDMFISNDRYWLALSEQYAQVTAFHLISFYTLYSLFYIICI